MDDMSIQINFGSIKSICCEMKFSFNVHSSGDTHVQIYASDPTDMRKSGNLATLDQTQYDQLKNIIKKIDETILKMQASGQIDNSFKINMN